MPLRRHKLLIFIFIFVILVSGCAGPQGYWANNYFSPPGFYGGLLHGFITPILILPWLFAKLFVFIFTLVNMDNGLTRCLDTFQLYASVHEDGYGWGYAISLLISLLRH